MLAKARQLLQVERASRSFAQQVGIGGADGGFLGDPFWAKYFVIYNVLITSAKN